MVGRTFVASLALAFALPAHAASNRGQMHMVDTVSKNVLAANGWAVQRTPHTEEKITLQIGLTMANEDALIAKLKDVSDPKSPNYGKYLDKDDVNKLAAPALDAADKVTRWLKDSGVESVAATADGQWITFRTTVANANDLLGADFQEYNNGGLTKLRTTSYSVPMDVKEHIDLIHPTTFFGKTQAFAPVHIRLDEDEATVDKRQVPAPGQGRPRDLKGQRVTDASCRTGITPKCLKQMYNIGDYVPLASSGSRVGFGSFLNETSSHADIALFQQKFGLRPTRIIKVNVNNASDDQSKTAEHGEANMDAQIQFGIAEPLPVTEFLTGGSPPFVPDLDVPDPSKNTNEPYVPYYQFLMTKSNAELPQAISNSYGEPEHTVPRNYATRTCLMIAMMGIRGVSVFESSGDTGIGSGCQSNDGQKRNQFNPTFPGTCPWITSIGGTESIMPETTWRDSSGGFSYYFSRPWYQEKQVSDYITKAIPPATLEYYKPFFNKEGRGFPDVSAHSLSPNYQVVNNGRLTGSGGTSASAPFWAAITALLNDARLRAQKPTMGFLNPWLYDYGTEFLVDIATGGSRGCNGVNHQTGQRFDSAGIIPWAAWNGTVGWDAGTGLGIPDFQKMLANAMKLVGAAPPASASAAPMTGPPSAAAAPPAAPKAAPPPAAAAPPTLAPPNAGQPSTSVLGGPPVPPAVAAPPVAALPPTAGQPATSVLGGPPVPPSVAAPPVPALPPAGAAPPAAAGPGVEATAPLPLAPGAPAGARPS